MTDIILQNYQDYSIVDLGKMTGLRAASIKHILEKNNLKAPRKSTKQVKEEYYTDFRRCPITGFLNDKK